MRGIYRLLAMTLLLAVSPAGSASAVIEVEALFTNAAVLRIDGERKMLKAGQSYRGVTLVAAHSGTATVEVDGQSLELGLSRRVGAHYETPAAQVVSIPRDALMQYQTGANINGRSMQVLVDTGANVVALNSTHARALGVDYTAGAPARVETASGTASAWIVTLSSVDVGGIRVDNVQATVVEGDYPSTVLLGMTYLRHVKMEESGGVLLLSRTW
ncbi:MAG: TIGR02281 family clan AA aspartic protease [Halieaceae bacterium]|jgi:aspartyl protease family protein|nr:TIGR02281 family clan AA aspartic protease [Halieaceae bacterium]